VSALCSQRQQLLSSWIFWVFTYLVVPLIRTGFYATECEGYRNRVFYFRKPVWAVVRRTTLQKLSTQLFHPLTEAEAELLVSRRQFGFAGLRMLPKSTKGVRLITNMSRRTRPVKARGTTSVRRHTYGYPNPGLPEIYLRC
jgi:telomerase reverse transcriptase